MEADQMLEQIWQRVLPDTVPAALPSWWLLAALAAALLAVTLAPLWRLFRPAVTVVHELGHAVVGILVGRRFTGFVVNGDMSGHAVTVGRRRGLGRVLCTAAGYPAPAVLGLGLSVIAFSTWVRPVLSMLLLGLVVSLVFARSLHTLAVLVVSIGVLGGLWWLGSPSVLALLCVGAGIFLLLGAWRHHGAVLARPRSIDDPQVLADLTVLPAWGWNGVFLFVNAAATLGMLRVLWPHLL